MVDLDTIVGIHKLADNMLFTKVKPDASLVEEALSFNAAKLHHISASKLRTYLVVLGQYLITLKYSENYYESLYVAWKKSYDVLLNKVLSEGIKISNQGVVMPVGKTLTEKRSWVLMNHDQVSSLYDKLQEIESKKMLLHNMNSPVEQYINTLKKEVDARAAELRYSGVPSKEV